MLLQNQILVGQDYRRFPYGFMDPTEEVVRVVGIGETTVAFNGSDGEVHIASLGRFCRNYAPLLPNMVVPPQFVYVPLNIATGVAFLGSAYADKVNAILAAKNNKPQVVCRYYLDSYEVDEFLLAEKEL